MTNIREKINHLLANPARETILPEGAKGNMIYGVTSADPDNRIITISIINILGHEDYLEMFAHEVAGKLGAIVISQRFRDIYEDSGLSLAERVGNTLKTIRKNSGPAQRIQIPGNIDFNQSIKYVQSRCYQESKAINYEQEHAGGW